MQDHAADAAKAPLPKGMRAIWLGFIGLVMALQGLALAWPAISQNNGTLYPGLEAALPHPNVSAMLICTLAACFSILISPRLRNARMYGLASGLLASATTITATTGVGATLILAWLTYAVYQESGRLP